MTITLVVPMPPNIANGPHGHWRSRHRAKLAYWNSLDLLAQLYQSHTLDRQRSPFVIPPPPPAPLVRATIASRMYLGGAMDDSNAMRRHKWVEDWLTQRRYIVDDRKKCLTWAGFPEQIVKRDGNYRLELTLTPASLTPAA